MGQSEMEIHRLLHFKHTGINVNFMENSRVQLSVIEMRIRIYMAI